MKEERKCLYCHTENGLKTNKQRKKRKKQNKKGNREAQSHPYTVPRESQSHYTELVAANASKLELAHMHSPSQGVAVVLVELCWNHKRPDLVAQPSRWW